MKIDEELSFDENKKSQFNKNNNLKKEDFEKEIFNLKNKINDLENEKLILKEINENKENIIKEINQIKIENNYYKKQIEILNNQVKQLIEIKSDKIIDKKDEESLLISEEDKNNIEKLNLEISRLNNIINQNKENIILLNSQIQKDKIENNKTIELNKELLEEKKIISEIKENLILENKNFKNELIEKNQCIENLNNNNKEWENEYYELIKELSIIKNENEKKIKEFKKIVLNKYKLIISLTNQIKEYEVKCTDILNNISEEEKNKQIEILINEVNSKRKQIFDILTFNGLINNFEEFENVVNQIISQYNNFCCKENVQNNLKKLDFLVSNYRENEKKNNLEILNKLI